MSTLDRAITIAVAAHRGQTDKSSTPYILHPLRLMLRMSTPDEMIVAVLHDVVEDSPVTLESLHQAGFPGQIIEALECLTKRPGETYEDFVARARADPLARRVKLADIEDNLDVRRLDDLTDKDLLRIRKYHAAWKQLSED